MDHLSEKLITKIKVGIFTFLGLLCIAVFAILADQKPYWWRKCDIVYIRVDDATGLREKSSVKSLGIEVGYLKKVRLEQNGVVLGICLSAPVVLLPETRAYLREEGFLGDKFLEIKPVYYQSSEKKLIPMKPGEQTDGAQTSSPPPKLGLAGFEVLKQVAKAIHLERKDSKIVFKFDQKFLKAIPKRSLFLEAHASSDPLLSPTPSPYLNDKKDESGAREIMVGPQSSDMHALVGQVGDLVRQLSAFTQNLNHAISPQEMKGLMHQLHQVLEGASQTLAPRGDLTQTAQRSLAKLEDAIEQLRSILTRINRGEGSLGQIINDPSYADEAKKALTTLNQLLNRLDRVRFHTDLGFASIFHLGTRAWFELGIWPRADRYYMLGVAFDPRTTVTKDSVETITNGTVQRVDTQRTQPTQITLSLLLGKVFAHRYDFSIGLLYGDATGSARFRLGPQGNEDLFQIRNDVYIRSATAKIDDRLSVILTPFPYVYCRAGVESVRRDPVTQKFLFFVGAGISFDDEEIKLLFALK